LLFAFCISVFAGSRSDQAVSEDAALWLLKQARARLSGKPLSESRRTPREVTEPRRTVLFVTAFKLGQPRDARPKVGIGDSLGAALDSAIKETFNPESAERGEPDRIQIDVLKDFSPFEKRSSFSKLTAAEVIEAAAEGISVESGGRTFYLLPSEMIYGRVLAEDVAEQKADDLLDRAMARLGLPRDVWKSRVANLKKFHTESFVENTSRNRALRLVRACVPAGSIEKKSLLAAARSAGDYLVRMQLPQGKFHYIYHPLEDRYSVGSYNIVRHAGTAVALFELYRVTRDLSYLDSARRAVDYLKTRFKAARSGRALYVLDNDGKGKLGAAGLALVALTSQMELDVRSADPESARRLADHILSMQRKDGAFESYYRLKGDEPAGSVSLYYPGEAILGLVSLFDLNGDKRLLDAARHGADYLIYTQRKMSALPPDAWMMQALERLHRIGREPKYARHAIALAEAMIAEQYTASDLAGYAGGFRPGLPRATPAASRAEGLVAAYRLARKIDDARASKIKAALVSSARFQLSQQFNDDNSFFLPNPARAAGGVRAGLTSMRVRIDFVQHNIAALLGTAELL
jgi:AMMECR1 domain-containing protein